MEELQKAIVGKHLANDNPLFKKKAQRIKIRGQDLKSKSELFSISYELGGVRDRSINFLPLFDYNVSTICFIKIPTSLLQGHICINENLKFQLKPNPKPIKVVIPELQDFFQLRNLAQKNNLKSIVQTNKTAIVDACSLEANFSFRIFASSHGNLVAFMDINHIHAERIIELYLNTIDKKFRNYQILEQYFKEKDGNGKKLYSDQQSKKYNLERDRLHQDLFDRVKEIFNFGKLDYKFVKY
ncbi:MAG: hypothetical protein KJ939_05855 [Nanoarchaeota archaeon]|nr:hypothetical protein [Nanoarchaeota archaeon]MBU4352573.1 hypothetical protein [Nanoarchaeota archaeon]MCG2719970.1 hypothetical protein [Nanoarchaeota archaeon]